MEDIELFKARVIANGERWKAAKKELTELKEERLEIVGVEAAKHGVTQAQIAEWLGVTHWRVSQMKMEWKRLQA